jgi:hypothetical protein
MLSVMTECAGERADSQPGSSRSELVIADLALMQMGLAGGV